MRRLLPTAARSFLIHSRNTAAVVGAGLLAMAAAPMAPNAVADDGVDAARPEAAPVVAVAEPAGPVTRDILFETPLPGHAVNSAFGLRKLAFESKARRHEGIDIAAPRGTSVYAAAEAVVLRTGYDAGGYGNFVELRHPNGMTTLYGHLSRIDVASGSSVESGHRIGLVGSTGRSTGPHLHFEVRRDHRVVNPVRVLGQRFQVEIEV